MKVAQIVKQVQKEHGEKIGGLGHQYPEAPRLPTGIFELDLMLGGGFPRSRLSQLYGAESSGKTMLAYLLIAETQRRGLAAVLLDVEGTYDAAWAKKCGVDPDALVVLEPNTVEQCSDIAEDFAYADDLGLLIVDSVAALLTQNELESETGKMAVGGSALLATRMMKKMMTALKKARSNGIDPAILLINQIRTKVGVLYGDTESLPGGNAAKFFPTLNVRLHAKKKVDKAVHPSLNTWATTTATIKKAKLPHTSLSCEFDLCLYEHEGLQVGQTDSWKLAHNLMRGHGIITKVGTTYEYDGMTFPTLSALRELYRTDPVMRAGMQDKVVAAVKSSPPPKNAESEAAEESE